MTYDWSGERTRRTRQYRLALISLLVLFVIVTPMIMLT